MGGIAGNGAAGHGQRAGVAVDAAAKDADGVAGNSAVSDGNCPNLVENTAALAKVVNSAVSRNGAAGYGQRAVIIVDTIALICSCCRKPCCSSWLACRAGCHHYRCRHLARFRCHGQQSCAGCSC